MNQDMIMIRKINFYLVNKTTIHIGCIGSKFFNGTISKFDSEEQLIVFKDCKLGEMPIPIQEINKIEPFKEASG